MLNLKIIENNKYFIIPMIIFFDTNENTKTKFRLYISDNYKLLFKNFKVLLNNDIEKFKNQIVPLKTIHNRFVISDCVEQYSVTLHNHILGFIVWYNSNNDTEFLEPTILSAELTLYKNNIKFSKIIDIEKIKFNNKIGYFFINQ
jgi:hypothetical protein